MLERVLARVLNQSLGWIVEDLDAHDLKLGVFSGDLVLKDLQLKPDGLATLGLPLKMSYGKISRLRLKVPWTNLRAESVVIEIEEVYAVFQPFSPAEAAEHKARANSPEAVLKRKQRELQAYEDAMAQLAEGERSESYREAFVSKLFAKVMNNLQVVVNSIHIRLERIAPSFPSSASSYACGVSLQRFVVKSPEQPSDEADIRDLPTTKRVQIVGFRIYWDSGRAVRSALTSDDASVNLVPEVMTGVAPGAEPILDDYDLSLTLSIHLNGKPKDASTPATLLQCDIPRVNLRVQKHQINGAIALSNYFTRLAAQPAGVGLRATKPLSRPIDDPKGWWQFAIASVRQQLSHRRKSEVWDQVVEAKRKQTEYIRVYLQTLTSSWSKGVMQRTSLEKHVQEELARLEARLDVETLTEYRSQARKVFRERSEPSSWMSSMARMFRSDDRTSFVTLSNEERQEIANVLELDSDAKESSATSLAQAGNSVRVEFSTTSTGVEIQLGTSLGFLKLELQRFALTASTAGENSNFHASLAHVQLVDSLAEECVIDPELGSSQQVLSFAGSVRGPESSFQLDLQTVHTRITASLLRRVLTALGEQQGERLDAILADRAEQLQRMGNERIGSALSRAKQVQKLKLKVSVAPQVVHIENSFALRTGTLSVDTDVPNRFIAHLRDPQASVDGQLLLHPSSLRATIHLRDNGVKDVDVALPEPVVVDADHRKLSAFSADVAAILAALPQTPRGEIPEPRVGVVEVTGSDVLVSQVSLALTEVRVHLRDEDDDLIASLKVSELKATLQQHEQHMAQILTIEGLRVDDSLRDGLAMVEFRGLIARDLAYIHAAKEDAATAELLSMDAALFVPTLNRLIAWKSCIEIHHQASQSPAPAPTPQQRYLRQNLKVKKFCAALVDLDGSRISGNIHEVHLERSNGDTGGEMMQCRFEQFLLQDEALGASIAETDSVLATKTTSAQEVASKVKVERPRLTFRFTTYTRIEEAIAQLKLPPSEPPEKTLSEPQLDLEAAEEKPQNLLVELTELEMAVAHDIDEDLDQDVNVNCRKINRVALTLKRLSFVREESIEDEDPQSDLAEFVDALEEAEEEEDSDFFDARAGPTAVKRSSLEVDDLKGFTSGVMGERLLLHLTCSLTAVEDALNPTRVDLHLPLVLGAVSQSQIDFLKSLPYHQLMSQHASKEPVQPTPASVEPAQASALIQPSISLDKFYIGMTTGDSPTLAEATVTDMLRWASTTADLGVAFTGVRFSMEPGKNLSFICPDLGVFVDGKSSIEKTDTAKDSSAEITARWAGATVVAKANLNICSIKAVDMLVAFSRFDMTTPRYDRQKGGNPPRQIQGSKEASSWAWLRLASLEVEVSCAPLVIVVTPSTSAQWVCFSVTLPRQLAWKDDEHLHFRVSGIQIFSCASQARIMELTTVEKTQVLHPFEIEALAQVQADNSLRASINLSKLQLIIDPVFLRVTDETLQLLATQSTSEDQTQQSASTSITSPPPRASFDARGNFLAKLTIPLVKAVLHGEGPVAEIVVDSIEGKVSELQENLGRQDAAMAFAMAVNVWNSKLLHWEPFVEHWRSTVEVNSPEHLFSIPPSAAGQDRNDLTTLKPARRAVFIRSCTPINTNVSPHSLSSVNHITAVLENTSHSAPQTPQRTTATSEGAAVRVKNMLGSVLEAKIQHAALRLDSRRSSGERPLQVLYRGGSGNWRKRCLMFKPGLLHVFRRERDVHTGASPLEVVDLSGGGWTLKFLNTPTRRAHGFCRTPSLCCVQVVTPNGVVKVVTRTVDEKLEFCRNMQEVMVDDGSQSRTLEESCVVDGKPAEVRLKEPSTLEIMETLSEQVDEGNGIPSIDLKSVILRPAAAGGLRLLGANTTMEIAEVDQAFKAALRLTLRRCHRRKLAILSPDSQQRLAVSIERLMLPLSSRLSSPDLLVDVLAFPSCERQRATAALDSKTSRHLYFNTSHVFHLLVPSHSLTTLRIEVFTNTASYYPSFSATCTLTPDNSKSHTLHFTPSASCTITTTRHVLQSSATAAISPNESTSFHVDRSASEADLLLRFQGRRLGRLRLWRSVQLCTIVDLAVKASGEAERRVLVIGDVSIGDDVQTVEVHSGAVIRTELRSRVTLRFHRLYQCEQPRVTRESDFKAFDNDTTSTWEEEVDDNGRAMLEFSYVTPRDVAMYVVRSSQGVAQTLSWKLEVLEEDGVWTAVDQRQDVMLREAEQHAFVPREAKLGTDFRLQFNVSGTRKQRQYKQVRIGSIQILSRRMQRDGEMCEAPYCDVEIAQGRNAYVPVDAIAANGAVSVGESALLLVHDLLGIPPSAPQRWMDYSYFSDQPPIHHSLQYEEDKACVFTTAFIKSKLNTVQWIVTLSPPLLIHNLLPWPAECSYGTKSAEDKSFKPFAQPTQLASGASGENLCLASSEGRYEWLTAGPVDEVHLRLGIPQKQMHMQADSALLLLSAASAPNTPTIKQVDLVMPDGSALTIQVELSCVVPLQPSDITTDDDEELGFGSTDQRLTFDEDEGGDGEAAIVSKTSGESKEGLAEPLLQTEREEAPEVHYVLQGLSRRWQIRIYCKFCCLNLSGLPLLFAEKQRRKVEADEKEAETMEAPAANHALIPFSSRSEKMQVSLRDKQSTWSQRFGLASGMKGTITLSSASSTATKMSRVYQLGVSIASAPGAFWRTQIIRFYPQFLIQNKCNTTVTVIQKHSSKDTGLVLEPSAVHPFHPVDINGDGKLDASDFLVYLQVDREDATSFTSNYLLIDSVRQYVVQMAPTRDKETPFLRCTASNALAPLADDSRPADTLVLGVDVTLHEGVVVVSIVDKGVSAFYAVRNRLVSYSALVVQHNEPLDAAAVLSPGKTAPWSYSNSQGSALVDILLEEVGIAADPGGGRRARRVSETVALDISSIGATANVHHAGRTIEVKVVLSGTTRVLDIGYGTPLPTGVDHVLRLLSYERYRVRQVPPMFAILAASSTDRELDSLLQLDERDDWEVNKNLQGEEVSWKLKDEAKIAAIRVLSAGKPPASLHVAKGDVTLLATQCLQETFQRGFLTTFLLNEDTVDAGSQKSYAWKVPAGVAPVHRLNFFEVAQHQSEANVAIQIVEAHGLELPLLHTRSFVIVKYGACEVKSADGDGPNPVYDTQVFARVDDMSQPLRIRVYAKSVLSKESQIYSQEINTDRLLQPADEDARSPPVFEAWVVLSKRAAVRVAIAKVETLQQKASFASLQHSRDYQETLRRAKQEQQSQEYEQQLERVDNAVIDSGDAGAFGLEVRVGVCAIRSELVKKGRVYAALTFGGRVLKTRPMLMKESISLDVIISAAQGSLGVKLRETTDGNIVVDEVGTGALQDSGVTPGMKLLYIGEEETLGMPVSTVADLLHTSHRPVKLRFKKDAKPGQKLAFLDKCLEFSDVDALIGQAQGSMLRLVIFQKSGGTSSLAEGSINVEEGKEVILPLLYLFGADEEVDSKKRELSEVYTAADRLVGLANIRVSPFQDKRKHSFSADLRHGPFSVGKVAVVVRWKAKREESSLAYGVDTLVDISLEQVGISVVTALPNRRELMYCSVSDVRLCFNMLRSRKRLADIHLGRIQVDNQMPNAEHPVLLSMKSLRVPSSGEEHDGMSVEILPALKLTSLFQAFDNRAVYVEYLDCFLQETTMKVEERIVLELQGAFGGAATEDQGEAISEDIVQLLQRDPLLGALSGETNGNGLKDTEKSIIVGSLDIKPTRLYLTFAANQDEDVSGSNFEFLQVLRGVPLLEGLSSVLVNTLVSITNAPLQFEYLKISNDKKPLPSFIAILIDKYKTQAMQGLLNVIGATDILGSPVQLVQSFGKGAYSFFYEPALAMSQGYGKIGTGLQRGSLDLIFSALRATSESLLKVSTTASKALARSSMDPSYVRRNARRLRSSADDPISVHEGFRQALRAIWLGFAEGVTGLGDAGKVLGKPQQSLVAATSDTATSTGRAALGVLAKPASGVVNAVHEVSRAVINSTETDYSTVYPVRLQRYISKAAEPLNAFSNREAIGIAYLKFWKLEAECEYVYHVQTANPQEDHMAVVILTERLIIAVTKELTVDWVVPLATITLVSTENQVINVYTDSDLRTHYAVPCLFEGKAETMEAVIESILDGSFNKRTLLQSESEARTEDAVITNVVAGLQSYMREGRDSASLEKFLDKVYKVEATRYKWVKDDRGPSYVKYKLEVHSRHSSTVKTCWRRYSEFLQLRDKVARFYGRSRASLPLPPRRPWRLSESSIKERMKGLNVLLQIMTNSEAIKLSVEFKQFIVEEATRSHSVESAPDV